jgi:hypothetical protein
VCLHHPDHGGVLDLRVSASRHHLTHPSGSSASHRDHRHIASLLFIDYNYGNVYSWMATLSSLPSTFHRLPCNLKKKASRDLTNPGGQRSQKPCLTSFYRLHRLQVSYLKNSLHPSLIPVVLLPLPLIPMLVSSYTVSSNIFLERITPFIAPPVPLALLQCI